MSAHFSSTCICFRYKFYNVSVCLFDEYVTLLGKFSVKVGFQKSDFWENSAFEKLIFSKIRNVKNWFSALGKLIFGIIRLLKDWFFFGMWKTHFENLLIFGENSALKNWFSVKFGFWKTDFWRNFSLEKLRAEWVIASGPIFGAEAVLAIVGFWKLIFCKIWLLKN